ncbi:hypothetical protein WJX81_006967 [Elliptochloris bilobata]|uniref:Uncharacterized protein n=1 Tax=Elliptochloris bilobata TaxID=381761 RepID=A0AAW1RKL9_9CHLO
MHEARQPRPAAAPASEPSAAASVEPAAAEGAQPARALTAAEQKASAEAVSAWMFPWERRQMEGGTPLRTWEKAYWGLFVGGMAFLLYSRLFLAEQKKPDPKVAEEKEARKLAAARLALAGGTFAEDEDPFEGLTPREIQEYVAKATDGASASDPFEGMSPEEINAYMEQQQLAGSR